jgi:hypothetical protein
MKLLLNGTSRTVDDFIKNSIDNYLEFQNSSHFTVVNGEVMEDFNIFRDRYFDAIMSYTETRTLKDSEIKKYRYRPKRLSYDLYQCIDYWYILLMINRMSSMMEFNKRTIKVLTYEGVTFLKNLAKKEENDIILNKKEIETELNSSTT